MPEGISNKFIAKDSDVKDENKFLLLYRLQRKNGSTINKIDKE